MFYLLKIWTFEDLVKWYKLKFDDVTKNPDDHPTFQIQNGLLYHHRFDPIELILQDEIQHKSWKLVPEPKLIPRVLHENHDNPKAGHLGIVKTHHRIADYYFWPDMYQDVAKYVRACTVCQTSKPLNDKPAGRICQKSIKRPAQV